MRVGTEGDEDVKKAEEQWGYEKVSDTLHPPSCAAQSVQVSVAPTFRDLLEGS